MKKIYVVLVAALLAGPFLDAPARGETADRPRPVLSEFLESVLQQHPALEAAQAKLSAARSRASGQAQPLYNPALEFDYEDAESETKQIGLAQTFDWSGKRAARAGVAQAEVAAAAAAYDVTRKALLSELLAALAGHQTRLDIFRINEHRAMLNEDFLELSERRNVAGDLPQTELLTARLALAEARIEKSTAAADLSKAREGLIAIVGEARPLWPMLEGIPPQSPPSFDDALLDDSLLEDIPELRFVRAKSQTVRTRVRVAEKNRLPDPTFGIRGGEEGATKLFGIQLSIPLLVRNTFSAEVDAARADVIATEKNYSGVYRRAKARLTESRQRFSAVMEAWRTWRKGGAAPLEDQRRVLWKLWRAGEINAVDYLVQLNQTFATETAAAELRGRLWTAWFLWLDASGTVDTWMETLR